MKELVTEDEIIQAYPLMKQLRTHLSEETYLELVLEAQPKEGYRLTALYDDGVMTAVVGFQPMVTLYYGRFVWVSDLVTAEDRRSAGYGKKLLQSVEAWALNNGYDSIALSSGLQRSEAHRFYEEKMEYSKVSYVFRKQLP
ncbi:GNAT family N-acetyltransferase [Alkalicoccus chagannorensis]|uniref:GNAT family N-acetyltransferase n=1 Tax=Alkalicoccus chagannorensis TaxID=427072 RepID=UPI00047C8820|nr:GNAT family N-acetyltransferase [Alkalicoccus chagannorensis]